MGGLVGSGGREFNQSRRLVDRDPIDLHNVALKS
jgi:hypothetical protein